MGGLTEGRERGRKASVQREAFVVQDYSSLSVSAFHSRSLACSLHHCHPFSFLSLFLPLLPLSFIPPSSVPLFAFSPLAPFKAPSLLAPSCLVSSQVCWFSVVDGYTSFLVDTVCNKLIITAPKLQESADGCFVSNVSHLPSPCFLPAGNSLIDEDLKRFF